MKYKYKLRLQKRIKAKSQQDSKGCWIWSGASYKGYGRTGYTIDGVNKNVSVHRVSYEAFNGPIPDELLVRHKCDVKLCVNPDHLEIGTHADNSQDAIDRGGYKRGEDRADSKLTETDVLEIRAERNMNQREMGEKYGVSRHTISQVINRRSWKHI